MTSHTAETVALFAFAATLVAGYKAGRTWEQAASHAVRDAVTTAALPFAMIGEVFKQMSRIATQRTQTI